MIIRVVIVVRIALLSVRAFGSGLSKGSLRVLEHVKVTDLKVDDV